MEDLRALKLRPGERFTVTEYLPGNMVRLHLNEFTGEDILFLSKKEMPLSRYKELKSAGKIK